MRGPGRVLQHQWLNLFLKADWKQWTVRIETPFCHKLIKEKHDPLENNLKMIEFSKQKLNPSKGIRLGCDVFFCMNSNIRKQVKDSNHIDFRSAEFDSLWIRCILSGKEELDYSATLLASVWWIWATIYLVLNILSVSFFWEMSKTLLVWINTKTKLVDSCILNNGSVFRFSVVH